MTNIVKPRMIAWEKWVDPFGDAEEGTWPGAYGTFESDEALERIERINRGEKVEEEFSEFMEEEVVIPPVAAAVKQRRPVRLLSTPTGFMPLTEWNSPSQVYELWVAHTNFRITEELQDIIDSTDGVESLDIWTPYRFRIAVGRIFDSIEVKEGVRINLGAEPYKK